MRTANDHAAQEENTPVDNPIIQAMLNRKSIRKYRSEMPADEVIRAIVRAGQQAPFAIQLCSVILSRDREQHTYNAPLEFTICVDAHRAELVAAQRGWQIVMNDLFLLMLGMQDAALMAQNMVMAAESLGLGSCFLGAAPYQAKETIEAYTLPPRVFPMVGLVMGYPAEDPPPRPRYPLEFTLFEGHYPDFDEGTIRQAMAAMDDGYLAQDYYQGMNTMIPLRGGREETFTFETYSWTEHISRKVGQWHQSPDELLENLAACGFEINA
jgi:nitroreductase